MVALWPPFTIDLTVGLIAFKSTSTTFIQRTHLGRPREEKRGPARFLAGGGVEGGMNMCGGLYTFLQEIGVGGGVYGAVSPSL